MKPENKILMIIKNRYVVYIVAVFFIAITAFATVLMLNQFNNRVGLDNNANANDIISTFESDKNVKKLFDESYEKQLDYMTNIIHTLDDYDYSVSTQATKAILFTKNETVESNEIESIRGTIKKIINSYGLNDDTYSQELKSAMDYLVFTNSQTMCQLESPSLDTNTTGTNIIGRYVFSCTDKEDVDGEYKKIENLLELYRKSASIENLKLVSRSTKIEGNKSYSIVSITLYDNSYKLLLFAAINETWEYLGDLFEGDKKYTVGQYIITPELRQKVSDSKYGTFIIDDIDPSNN